MEEGGGEGEGWEEGSPINRWSIRKTRASVCFASPAPST